MAGQVVEEDFFIADKRLAGHAPRTVGPEQILSLAADVGQVQHAIAPLFDKQQGVGQPGLDQAQLFLIARRFGVLVEIPQVQIQQVVAERRQPAVLHFSPQLLKILGIRHVIGVQDHVAPVTLVQNHRNGLV